LVPGLLTLPRAFMGKWPDFRAALRALAAARLARDLLFEAGGVTMHHSPRHNLPSDDPARALAGERGINVRETIHIDRPVSEAYRFWRDLENLPRVLAHIERVTERPSGRSHWVLRGPAGLHFEWDADLINDVENRTIAWRSLPGADVVSAGSVTFAAPPIGRGTDLTVHLQCSLPGGSFGDLVARVLGQSPPRIVREELERVKLALERGFPIDTTTPNDPAREHARAQRDKEMNHG
jgi:uncharacterized membrane protein